MRIGRWLYHHDQYKQQSPIFQVKKAAVRLTAWLPDGIEPAIQILIGDNPDDPGAYWVDWRMNGAAVTLGNPYATQLVVANAGWYRLEIDDLATSGQPAFVWAEDEEGTLDDKVLPVHIVRPSCGGANGNQPPVTDPVQVTCADLHNLAGSASLVPGTWYAITDVQPNLAPNQAFYLQAVDRSTVPTEGFFHAPALTADHFWPARIQDPCTIIWMHDTTKDNIVEGADAVAQWPWGDTLRRGNRVRNSRVYTWGNTRIENSTFENTFFYAEDGVVVACRFKECTFFEVIGGAAYAINANGSEGSISTITVAESTFNGARVMFDGEDAFVDKVQVHSAGVLEAYLFGPSSSLDFITVESRAYYYQMGGQVSRGRIANDARCYIDISGGTSPTLKLSDFEITNGAEANFLLPSDEEARGPEYRHLTVTDGSIVTLRHCASLYRVAVRAGAELESYWYGTGNPYLGWQIANTTIENGAIVRIYSDRYGSHGRWANIVNSRISDGFGIFWDRGEFLLRESSLSGRAFIGWRASNNVTQDFEATGLELDSASLYGAGNPTRNIVLRVENSSFANSRLYVWGDFVANISECSMDGGAIMSFQNTLDVSFTRVSLQSGGFLAHRDVQRTEVIATTIAERDVITVSRMPRISFWNCDFRGYVYATQTNPGANGPLQVAHFTLHSGGIAYFTQDGTGTSMLRFSEIGGWCSYNFVFQNNSALPIAAEGLYAHGRDPVGYHVRYITNNTYGNIHRNF